jgi:predicted nucleic acid binding AN1-type Zn finger protein
MLVSCRCTNAYCLQCRMPEDHQCTFDFVKYKLDIRRLENPVIAGEKVSKI